MSLSLRLCPLSEVYTLLFFPLLLHLLLQPITKGRERDTEREREREIASIYQTSFGKKESKFILIISSLLVILSIVLVVVNKLSEVDSVFFFVQVLSTIAVITRINVVAVS